MKSGEPIPVVVFGGGPRLEHGVRRFLAMLHDHTDIKLLGVFCQSTGQSPAEVFLDLWRRRGFLSLPLLVASSGSNAARKVRHPRVEARLRSTLSRLGKSVRFVPDIHAPDVLERVRRLKPELGLIYGSPILRPELYEIPKHGTLGIHHGTLPTYRGKKTTFWEMYHGEPRAGVTIQLVDEGLDTGRIVQQGWVEIAARSRRAVWRDLEDVGLELYIRAILEVRAGTIMPRVPAGPPGRLYRDPDARQIMKLWWRQMRKRLLAR